MFEQPPDNEIVKYVAHLSWWVFVPRLFLAAIAALGGVLALFLDTGVISRTLEAIALCAVVYSGYLVLKKRSVRALITNDHVFVKHQLISLHTVTLNLQRIESVDIDQSAIQRILGYGDVVIRGLGNEDVPLKGLASPSDFQQAVMVTVPSKV